MVNKLTAAFLAAFFAAPAAANPDFFPRPNEIFPLLIADPRHIQVSASYYRLDGRNTSDLALGHSWGFARWQSGERQDWLWEADVEGMAYSRFNIGGGVNEFETVDFLGNLPVVVQHDSISFKGTLFHESSHLGDDYIRRTGSLGFRSSNEGLRAQVCAETNSWARGYAGTQFLIHEVPTSKRWSLQSGLEFFGKDLDWPPHVPSRPFLAQDFQWHQDVGWNMDSHTIVGIKIRLRKSSTRSMRLQAGYFTGHSPFGQFHSQKTHYADLMIAFEL